MSLCAGKRLFANRAEPDEKDNIFEKKTSGIFGELRSLSYICGKHNDRCASGMECCQ